MKKNVIKYFTVGTLLSTMFNICFADIGRHIYNNTNYRIEISQVNGVGENADFKEEPGNPSCKMRSEGYDSPSCEVPAADITQKHDVYISYQGPTLGKPGSWLGAVFISEYDNKAKTWWTPLRLNIACDVGGSRAQGDITRFACQSETWGSSRQIKVSTSGTGDINVDFNPPASSY